MVCCTFIFICCKIFLNSSVISSLTHWLCKCVLFNFHVFVDFPVFILLLIYSFSPLWLKKILSMISIFENLLRLFYGLTYSLSYIHVYFLVNFRIKKNFFLSHNIFVLAIQFGSQDLSSLTRDWTQTHGSESVEC